MGNRQIVSFLEDRIADLQERTTTISTITQQHTDRQKELALSLENAKKKYSDPLHQKNKDFRDNLYHAYIDYAAIPGTVVIHTFLLGDIITYTAI